MRTLSLALTAACGLAAVAVATSAFAGPANPPQPVQGTAIEQVQYYPPYWGYPPYRPHHYRWWEEDRWRHRWHYSEAEQLNKLELDRLNGR